MLIILYRIVSKHSEDKIKLLTSHKLVITKQLVVDALRNPDKI